VQAAAARREGGGRPAIIAARIRFRISGDGMGIMSIIWMIVVGFIVGLLARFFYPGAVGLGFWMTTLLGIGGSLVGGVISSLIFRSADGKFHPAGWIMSIIGALILLILFAALLWRLLASGWRSKDPFGMMFAGGLASMILFQLVVNLGMVIGIMPITGIPLPFVSHGGASLISLAIGLGIVQSINIRQTRAEW